MPREVSYHRLFDRDVVEAAKWYDQRSAGLGAAFTANVKEAVALLIQNPDHATATGYEWRYLRIKRFPYIVLCHFHNDEVFFLGVLHTARSMAEWRKTRS